jgi:hypothetical protein
MLRRRIYLHTTNLLAQAPARGVRDTARPGCTTYLNFAWGLFLSTYCNVLYNAFAISQKCLPVPYAVDKQQRNDS